MLYWYVHFSVCGIFVLYFFAFGISCYFFLCVEFCIIFSRVFKYVWNFPHVELRVIFFLVWNFVLYFSAYKFFILFFCVWHFCAIFFFVWNFCVIFLCCIFSRVKFSWFYLIFHVVLWYTYIALLKFFFYIFLNCMLLRVLILSCYIFRVCNFLCYIYIFLRGKICCSLGKRKLEEQYNS